MATSTKDPHVTTASGILKKAYSVVEDARHQVGHPLHKAAKRARADAKVVNFQQQYGGGSPGISRKLRIPLDEAKSLVVAANDLYRVRNEWKAEQIAKARRQGYLVIGGGRVHCMDGIDHPDPKIRAGVERGVISSLIQGLCAEILQRVLKDCWERQVYQRHEASLILPLYDELVSSTHSRNTVDFIVELHGLMTQDVIGLPAPMRAAPSLGVNFADQIEIGWECKRENIERAIEEALIKL